MAKIGITPEARETLRQIATETMKRVRRGDLPRAVCPHCHQPGEYAIISEFGIVLMYHFDRQGASKTCHMLYKSWAQDYWLRRYDVSEPNEYDGYKAFVHTRYNPAPRDAQRTKLYRSENFLWREKIGSMSDAGVREIKDVIERALTSEWFDALCDERPSLNTLAGRVRIKLSERLTAHDGTASSWRAGDGTPQGTVVNHMLKLRPTSLSVPLILHELAHVVANEIYMGQYNVSTVQGHGAEFARIYIELMRTVLGDALAERLHTSMKAGGVRVAKEIVVPEPPSVTEKRVTLRM